MFNSESRKYIIGEILKIKSMNMFRVLGVDVIDTTHAKSECNDIDSSAHEIQSISDKISRDDDIDSIYHNAMDIQSEAKNIIMSAKSINNELLEYEHLCDSYESVFIELLKSDKGSDILESFLDDNTEKTKAIRRKLKIDKVLI